jgi:hypothetical protein
VLMLMDAVGCPVAFRCRWRPPVRRTRPAKPGSATVSSVAGLDIATKEQWTVLMPVANVQLTKAVNYEFRIDRVTLVATDRLDRRRQRLGVPIRLTRKSEKHPFFREFLKDSAAMGIVRMSGVKRQIERRILTIVRDELAILAASQLGYAKRHQTSAPAIAGERSHTWRSQLWMTTDGKWLQPNVWFGPRGSLRLDEHWLKFHRRVFFPKLLRLLRGHVKIAKAWREDLRRASVLIGLSQTANSVADAFLWNMVAAELLLTRQGDVVGDELPSRAEALMGWSKEWRDEDFRAQIQDAYQRRCRIVHQGERDSPTPKELFFTDDLLLCLLTNLVTHSRVFQSKDDVIAFSKRVEAEQLLGVRPRVRPKSLQMLHRTYRAKDYDVY